MDPDVDRRERAIRRLKTKREFRQHFFVYLAFSVFFIAIWLMTDRGYFWPIWPILGWGIGVVFHGWSSYGAGAKPISEEEIRQEMERESAPR